MWFLADVDKNVIRNGEKVIDRYIILSYNSIETQYMVFVWRKSFLHTICRSFFMKKAEITPYCILNFEEGDFVLW